MDGLYFVTPTGSGPTTPATQIQVPFAFDDASPVNVKLMASGSVVYQALLCITTAFDGTGASLTLGDAGQADRLMTAAQNDPYTVGNNESNPAHEYASSTQVRLTITPGTATQGAGVLVLLFKP